MKYWEELRTKWGFDDGGATPVGVEHYRTVYIRAVNQLARKYKSKVRAVAYDRSGLHNWCLILLCKKCMVQGTPLSDMADPRYCPAGEWREEDPDKAFIRAVSEAMDLELDSDLEVKVSIHRLRTIR